MFPMEGAKPICYNLIILYMLEIIEYYLYEKMRQVVSKEKGCEYDKKKRFFLQSKIANFLFKSKWQQ